MTGSPSLRCLPRKNVGLPGAWTVLLLRAVVARPAGCGSPSPDAEKPPSPSKNPTLSTPLGTRDEIVFVAAFPTAHTLAHPRIAGRVTASVARLATGWVCAPFAGRGSHPLDDVPNFMTSSQPHSSRTSLAWSHQNPYSPHFDRCGGAQPSVLRVCALNLHGAGPRRNERLDRYARP